MSSENIRTGFRLFSRGGEEDEQCDNDRSRRTTQMESFEVNIPFREAEKDEKEDIFLLQSMTSNTVFLTAGALYLTIAIWELKPPQTPADTLAYNIIGYVAPITYLINSVIDVHLANRIRRHKKKKKRAVAPQPTDTHENGAAFIIGENPTTTKVKKSKRKRLRKFAAHRRGLSAAMSFFIAALFSVLSIIAEWLGAADQSLAVLDGISVHTYMLSALIAIAGSRIITTKSVYESCLHLMNLHDADTLETLGDILFLLGSLVDAVLFDCHFDDDVVGWPILAAALWCIDALLYLNSDWITAKSRQSTNQQPFGWHPMIGIYV
jgi:hypothetical protein